MMLWSENCSDENETIVIDHLKRLVNEAVEVRMLCINTKLEKLSANSSTFHLCSHIILSLI